MTRIIAGFCLGILATLLGLGVILDAHSMATTWQSLGPALRIGATNFGQAPRIGTTDPGQETLYRMLGFAILGFGLLVTAMALNHWMGGRDVELRGKDGVKSGAQ